MEELLNKVYNMVSMLETFSPTEHTNATISSIYSEVIYSTNINLYPKLIGKFKNKQQKIWDSLYFAECEMERDLAYRIVG